MLESVVYKKQSEIADFPRPFCLSKQVVPLVVMILALVLIGFTDRTYRGVYKVFKHMPGSLADFATEIVNPFTILIMCGTIWIFDRRRRPALAVFLVSLAMLGVVHEPIKQIAGRARPRWSIDMSDSSRAWMKRYSAQHPGTSFDSGKHDTWMGFRAGRPYFEAGFVSFPSGHSAQAFLMAAFLTALYPAGRGLWLLLAVACAMARVAGRAHYLEDVLFGGAFGWLIAQWVFSWAWPVRLGGRFFLRQRGGEKFDATG